MTRASPCLRTSCTSICSPGRRRQRQMPASLRPRAHTQTVDMDTMHSSCRVSEHNDVHDGHATGSSIESRVLPDKGEPHPRLHSASWICPLLLYFTLCSHLACLWAAGLAADFVRTVARMHHNRAGELRFTYKATIQMPVEGESLSQAKMLLATTMVDANNSDHEFHTGLQQLLKGFHLSTKQAQVQRVLVYHANWLFVRECTLQRIITMHHRNFWIEFRKLSRPGDRFAWRPVYRDCQILNTSTCCSLR